jgi:hypothetical protein
MSPVIGIFRPPLIVFSLSEPQEIREKQRVSAQSAAISRTGRTVLFMERFSFFV